MTKFQFHEAFMIMIVIMIMRMSVIKIRLFNDYEVHDDDDNDGENTMQTLCSQLGLWKCQCLQRPSTMQCLIMVTMKMIMTMTIIFDDDNVCKQCNV